MRLSHNFQSQRLRSKASDQTCLNLTPRSRHYEALNAVIEHVRLHMDSPITLEDIAKAAKMPRGQLTRRFQMWSGTSPMRWIWIFRTAMARELLKEQPFAKVREIALACGFVSNAHFSRRFREIYGESPAHFRRLSRAQPQLLPPAESLPQARNRLMLLVTTIVQRDLHPDAAIRVDSISTVFGKMD